MRSWSKAVVCVAALIASMSAGAVELKTGNVVVIPKSQTMDDDILAAASHVTIEPDVEGDVTAAGQSVAVAGRVRDSVMLAGREVHLTGPVGNDAWLAGQSVTIGSKVADNAYAAGSTVVLATDGAVGKDLLIGGGEVSVQGSVGRNLRAAAGDLVIGGTITGNVYASADSIRLFSTAVVKGNLFYESPNRVEVDPGAKVMGKIEHKLPPKEKMKPVFWSGFAWWLGRLIAAILFGAALLTLFPDKSREAADTVRRSFWFSLGVGLVVAIVVPVACVIGLITVVGIPLALAVLFVYSILLYATGIFASLALGTWILGRGRQTPPKPLGSMILGALVLGIVFLVPWIGWLVKLGVVLAGLGAFCVTWWRGRTPQNLPIT